jgi:hypothetical protein
MHFYFNRLGFVPLVWGFPKVNQTGKQSGKAQSLVFPFDRSSKAGASTEFLNRFGQALAATVPLSRGKSQLSIAVSHLSVSESEKLLDVVFRYVDEAYKPTS